MSKGTMILSARVGPSEVEAIDTLAGKLESSRSAALREVFAAGLEVVGIELKKPRPQALTYDQMWFELIVQELRLLRGEFANLVEVLRDD